MIEIKNLDFSYKNTPVFKNINLSFKEGSIYGLLGENGVGKTTLLKIICGLQHPTTGTVTLDGFKCSDREPDMLKNIFFLPDEVQLPESSTPQRYVDELVPFYPRFAQGTFLHMMQELEVEPGRRFREMSFGQQKKSLIACALSLGTNYVLLDEPTNGLDIPSKAQLRSILSKRMDDNTTIIISTHQVKDVENLIDPIVILTHNDVLLDASVEKITSRLFFEYGGPSRPEAL
nr:ATP-binding cassette domain-containing protein [Bacteroidales bacterium]